MSPSRATTALCLALLGCSAVFNSCVLANNGAKAQKKAFLQMTGSTSGNYDGPDVKHAQLQGKEVTEADWKEAGCKRVSVCPSGEESDGKDLLQGCGQCYSEVLLRSDLQCSGEKDYDSIVSVEPPLVGRCEWTFAIYRCPDTTAESSARRSFGGCSSDLKDLDFYGISLAGAIPTPHNNGYQIGTAWATCFFNSDSETCGEPFCGQMVLSLQGTLHAVPALIDDGSEESRRAPSSGNISYAYIATAPVQVTAVSKSYEYTHGVLEYVAGHQTLVSQRQSGSSTSYPAGTNVYIPYSYHMMLVADSAPNYDDAYGTGDKGSEPDAYVQAGTANANKKAPAYKYYQHAAKH